MSMLTKAFVVLVTVLAILLVALTASSVAQYENLQAQVTERGQQVELAKQSAARSEYRAQETISEYNQRLNVFRETESRMADQINQLASQLRDARAAAANAQSNVEKWEASLERLSAAQAQSASLLESLNSELDRRREESVELRTRLVEASSRVAELSTHGDSLERQVRRLREQMQASAEARREMEELFASLPDDVRRSLVEGEGGDRGPTPPHDIAGRILQVSRQGGETFVQVDVGRNDGVAERMAFMVYRGEQYLARLVIGTVDADTAVGHLEYIQGEIRQGDSIFAGAN